MAPHHREPHPGATRNFSLGRPGAGRRAGALTADRRTTPAARPTKKHPLTIHTVKPAPAVPHRPTTQHRITADDILAAASRGSTPQPVSHPCITIAQARHLGLIPPNAIIVGDPLGCITYTIKDGHIIIALKYAPFPAGRLPPDGHTPRPPNELPIAWRLNGEPYFGDVIVEWTSQKIIDELSAGFVGTMLDCYSSASPDAQAALIETLDEFCNLGEVTNPEPINGTPHPGSDTDTDPDGERRAACEDDNAEAQARGDPLTDCDALYPRPRPSTDRDPTTQALYDCLKRLVCDLLDWLYDPSCDTTSGSLPEDLGAALVLAEFCQTSLLDDVLAKLTRCAAAPPPEPPTEPLPGAPPEDIEPIPHGGCVCNTWPGWVICPDCEATSGYKCTCPGDCIPFPASTRNC